MEKQTHKMMAPGFQTKKLAVCHVRQPRERMPVPVKSGFEGPDKSFSGQAGPHIMILHHITVIVEADKFVGDDLSKNRKYGGNKDKTYIYFSTRAVHSRLCPVYRRWQSGRNPYTHSHIAHHILINQGYRIHNIIISSSPAWKRDWDSVGDSLIFLNQWFNL